MLFVSFSSISFKSFFLDENDSQLEWERIKIPAKIYLHLPNKNNLQEFLDLGVVIYEF